MNHKLTAWLFLAVAGALPAAAVLEHSDVVLMYQARQATYAEYGATVLAWGGKPTPQSLAEAKGLKFFGSVGMVTEFSRYYERFPQTYQQGLCRDVFSQPVKVPWLTDHQHKGIPYWWCCTQQPQFRQYLSERVVETVKAGAEGVHIDDHLGTAGGLWLGVCFCDRCVEGFGAYLKSLPPSEIQRLGIENPDRFNYRETVAQWLNQEPSQKRKATQHPLWPQWTIYQCRAAAAFMQELHELASKTAGHFIRMGANAGLLWPRHLGDYQSVDLFSAEILHHAEQKQVSDLPLFAYRLADAMGRPLAATASGQDWAFIKENNLPGLVCCWIALSYAAGNCLMAPHHQWCYTTEKGTHWYDGPGERFAPLYQFVRRHAALFDDYESFADLAVVLPHRSFVKNPERWFDIGNQLAAANVTYRLLVAGDEIVDHPLTADSLRACRALLLVETNEFLPADRQLVEAQTKNQRVFMQVKDAVAALRPAVQVKTEAIAHNVPIVLSDGVVQQTRANIKTEARVRVLPRVKQDSAVVHLVNYEYDAAGDHVRPLKSIKVQVDLPALGVAKAATCRWVVPQEDPKSLTIENGTVEVPQLDLWGILVFENFR